MRRVVSWDVNWNPLQSGETEALRVVGRERRQPATEIALLHDEASLVAEIALVVELDVPTRDVLQVPLVRSRGRLGPVEVAHVHDHELALHRIRAADDAERVGEQGRVRPGACIHPWTQVPLAAPLVGGGVGGQGGRRGRTGGRRRGRRRHRAALRSGGHVGERIGRRGIGGAGCMARGSGQDEDRRQLDEPTHLRLRTSRGTPEGYRAAPHLVGMDAHARSDPPQRRGTR